MVDPLDDEGVPRFRPVPAWLEHFDLEGPLDPRATRWLLAILRYSRADGSPVFGPRGRSASRLRGFDRWVQRLADPSLAAILARWLPSRVVASPPPTPSDTRADRALAILRPDWDPRGDLVAIDHREAGDRTLLEVSSRGKTWLGPSWTSNHPPGKASQPRPSLWSSNVYADAAEWTYRIGTHQVTRSVALLRGRSMAILGQQVDGRGVDSEIRLELGEGIAATPVEGSRALLLSAGRGQPTARLIPLGLPSHDRPTDLGSIAIDGRHVVIRQVGGGRKRWLPFLICWGKPPTSWRPLTVAERSKTCGADVAFACRVAWGLRDDGLVLYRSLAKPALRSFLGHQTSARILVGSFNKSGEVRPILKVDA